MTSTMNIYAQPGTKVRFHNEGGFDHEQAEALKHLTVGETYTVVYTDVGSWCTRVYLREAPGQSFNSVQFEDVAPS